MEADAELTGPITQTKRSMGKTALSLTERCHPVYKECTLKAPGAQAEAAWPSSKYPKCHVLSMLRFQYVPIVHSYGI